MTSFNIPLSLIFAHWLGDWALQSDRMALGKSKSWLILLEHVSVVSLILLLWFLWFFAFDPTVHLVDWFKWVGLNFAAHLITDALTSRLNARLWQAEQRHYFFVSIGFDQFLHYTAYAIILRYLA